MGAFILITMEDKFTEIDISVYHIIHFTELIDKSFLSFEKLLSLDSFKDNRNEDVRRMIFMNISCQILIYTKSLQEEYYDHFNISKAETDIEKAKVEQLCEVLKPIFTKINEWDEIKAFRNDVLAHKPRIRNTGYKSVFLLRGLSGYNIPEKIIDFAFLVQCTNVIKNFIYDVFKDEYHKIDDVINSDKYSGKPLISQRDYAKEFTELKNEIKIIQKRIEERFQ